MRAPEKIYTKIPSKPTSQLGILLLFCDEIGHLRDLNILTWFRGFQEKPLYVAVFSLCPSLFWELSDKRNWKKILNSQPCYNI